jgi:hypothetical protein
MSDIRSFRVKLVSNYIIHEDIMFWENVKNLLQIKYSIKLRSWEGNERFEVRSDKTIKRDALCNVIKEMCIEYGFCVKIMPYNEPKCAMKWVGCSDKYRGYIKDKITKSLYHLHTFDGDKDIDVPRNIIIWDETPEYNPPL